MFNEISQHLIIIPAIVESLHSECFGQFALKDARTAFILPNCTYAQKTTITDGRGEGAVLQHTKL